MLAMPKKILFIIILIAIPILIFVGFETVLRVINYGNDLKLFEPSKKYPGYFQINPRVTKRFFTKNPPTSPTNDIFLIQKPQNTYRIFVMGSSTVRAFPYEVNTSISRVLFFRLRDIFPDKNIEVVNVAMAAINSYALADFIDEIIEQKPDAIIIYAGHNEYYGALGAYSIEQGNTPYWIKKLHLKLIHLRSYQLVQNIIHKFSSFISKEQRPLTATLMERMSKNKHIAYQSDIYHKGLQQYEKNMTEIFEKVSKNKIPIIISELVSNVKDLPPFYSLKTNEYPPAIELFNLAKVELTKGNITEARKLFYQAKDLDAIRFRAPEDINKLIHQLASKYNMPVIPMKDIFEKHSKSQIIGYDLITEHLHPNIDGYFLMANAFLHELKKQKLISNQWDTTRIKTNEYYRYHWGFTVLDSLVADKRVKTLTSGWPFTSDTIINDYLYNYKPTSLEDSLALLCVKYDNISITMMHTELAKNYLKQGSFEKAFNEYRALTYIEPYNIQYYAEALNCATFAQNDSLAKTLLLSMPLRDSSFFALMRLGRISQKQKDHKTAIEYFNKALNVAKPGDNKIYAYESLYFSYLATNDNNKAKRMLLQIKDLDPKYKINPNRKQDIILIVDNSIKPLLDEALKKARQGQFQEALTLLEESIKQKETAFAYQLMGSIYFQLKDNRSFEYLEKAYLLNPFDEPTINNLIILSLMNRNLEKAKFYIEKYKNVGDIKEYNEFVKMLNQTMTKKQ